MFAHLALINLVPSYSSYHHQICMTTIEWTVIPRSYIRVYLHVQRIYVSTHSYRACFPNFSTSREELLVCRLTNTGKNFKKWYRRYRCENWPDIDFIRIQRRAEVDYRDFQLDFATH